MKPDPGLLIPIPMASSLFYPPIDYPFNHDACGPKPSRRMHETSGYGSVNFSVRYPERSQFSDSHFRDVQHGSDSYGLSLFAEPGFQSSHQHQALSKHRHIRVLSILPSSRQNSRWSVVSMKYPLRSPQSSFHLRRFLTPEANGLILCHSLLRWACNTGYMESRVRITVYSPSISRYLVTGRFCLH
jgi:hypothetical protein